MPEDHPSISRTASSTSQTPITQDALDRLESNLATAFASGISGLERLMMVRLGEHERRINELNNSHDKAVEAKRLSDEAATRIQERTVTRNDLDVWKREVDKRLDLAAGAAKTWALLGSVAGSIIAGSLVAVAVRMFTN